jgi:hypothetical protein
LPNEHKIFAGERRLLMGATMNQWLVGPLLELRRRCPARKPCRRSATTRIDVRRDHERATSCW